MNGAVLDLPASATSFYSKRLCKTMPSRSTGSGLPGSSDDRRANGRLAAIGLPLGVPSGARVVDCSRGGIGIEFGDRLPIGSLTKVGVLLADRELTLVGRVCWSRPVSGAAEPRGESGRVYRAGVAFLEGQSFVAWDALLADLTAASRRRAARRPKRRIVRWRPPSAKPQ